MPIICRCTRIFKFKAETFYKTSLWNTVVAYYLLERIKHPRAFFVYAGGSTREGTIGYVNAAFELKEQIINGRIPEPEIIFCPLSSGGTLAGLALGTHLAGLRTRVTGVRVADSHLGPFQACTPNIVKKQMKQAYAFLRRSSQRLPEIQIRTPEILHDYFGGGYGVTTKAANRQLGLLKVKEDIVLDATYTSKAFAAVDDYCRKHNKNAGTVLYWHTYNSVDLSGQANSVDYRRLPKAIQRFIK